MKRRPLLVALGSAGLAGCSAGQLLGGSGESASESFESVSRRATPTPPGSVTRESARSFVREHEESRTHNALVADASDTIREFSVREPAVRVVTTTERGVVLLSTIRGQVTYACEPRDTCSATHSLVAENVVHFVGPDGHVRVPEEGFQWLGDEQRQMQADRTPPTGPPALLRVYDFARAGETGDDGNAATNRRLSIRVTRDDETVFADTVEPSAPLSVVPSVVSEPDRYRLIASLSGTETTHEWELPDGGGAAWHWTSLLVTPGDELVVRELSAARLPSS